jgi:cytochrome c peroxidase
MKRIAFALAALAALASTPALAQAAAALYKDADLAVGEKLLREHRCAECHSRKLGGDGNAIYRPLGRINTPGALRGMVEQCNLELNLALFPDEVTSIAAVLNRDHYRFK